MNKEYTDKQLVEGILANKRLIIEYFFFKKCAPLMGYIVYSVFDGKVEANELISELYLYLSSNDWYKLRQFDYRSKLTTWTSVVAIRFFQKKRDSLIDKESTETLIDKAANEMIANDSYDNSWDVHNAIKRIPNQRYQMVIMELDINEKKTEILAKEMNITVDNLYNIHRRGLLQLKMVMSRKEDYYD